MGNPTVLPRPKALKRASLLFFPATFGKKTSFFCSIFDWLSSHLDQWCVFRGEDSELLCHSNPRLCSGPSIHPLHAAVRQQSQPPNPCLSKSPHLAPFFFFSLAPTTGDVEEAELWGFFYIPLFNRLVLFFLKTSETACHASSQIPALFQPSHSYKGAGKACPWWLVWCIFVFNHHTDSQKEPSAFRGKAINSRRLHYPKYFFNLLVLTLHNFGNHMISISPSTFKDGPIHTFISNAIHAKHANQLVILIQ